MFSKEIFSKFNLFLDFIKVNYYEFKSYRMLEKVNYRIEGSCLKCGDCCRCIYCLDTYTEREFNLMTMLYPKYKRFKIVGKDSKDNLILACKLIGDDNLCPVYNNRLKMCCVYPNSKMLGINGKLHERCGYKIIFDKTFKDYLDNNTNESC